VIWFLVELIAAAIMLALEALVIAAAGTFYALRWLGRYVLSLRAPESGGQRW
jgi:hypothetical protein